jgi:DNA-binding HxlR family transcriptional regulator
MSTPSVDKIQYFDESPTCACKVSLDYLGDKWILVIIRDLFRKRFTFSQFMYDSDEKIATNTLTDRLKKLRSQHIIDFRLNDKNKKIKEYYLTDRGVELYDIIYQLQYWTLQNVNFTFSENTKKWKKLSEELPREKVIEQYKQSYKEFRKKTFGF